jgi:MSHA biogenesis protein MshP
MTRRHQSGLGAIAAIMILVILAALAAAIVTFSAGQQTASAQDVQSVRALQAASAGTEWGLHRALKNNTCDTQTWTHPDNADFKVTVACSQNPYNDGETAPGVPRQLRVFRIVATACNGAAAACPDNAAAAGPAYVERQRVAVAYCELSGGVCAGP